jgi:hypothetical protein
MSEGLMIEDCPTAAERVVAIINGAIINHQSIINGAIRQSSMPATSKCE